MTFSNSSSSLAGKLHVDIVYVLPEYITLSICIDVVFVDLPPLAASLATWPVEIAHAVTHVLASAGNDRRHKPGKSKNFVLSLFGLLKKKRDEVILPEVNNYMPGMVKGSHHQY